MPLWAAGATVLTGAMTSGGGGGGGGSDPGAAIYQAEQERKAQAEALRQSRVNRYSNKGSTTWGSEWVPKYDKNGRIIGRVQRPTLTENLAPDLKAAEDAAMKANLTAAQKAAARGEFDAPAEIQWNDQALRDYGDAMYREVMDRAAPQMERDRASMETKLRQQGLVPGTAAYDRAMQNLLTSQGDVSTQAALRAKIGSLDAYRSNFAAQNQAQAQTFNQRRTKYNMPMEDAGFWQGYTNSTPRPNTPMDNGSTPQPGSVPNYAAMSAQNSYADAQQRALDAQMWGNIANTAGGALGEYFNTPKRKDPNKDSNYDPFSGMTTDYPGIRR